MYRLGSKFYRIQFAHDQIHSQHLVLVASCRTRTKAGQRAQGFTRSFFDKSVRICRCVPLKMPNNLKISSHRVNQMLCVYHKKMPTLRNVEINSFSILQGTKLISAKLFEIVGLINLFHSPNARYVYCTHCTFRILFIHTIN